jgi:E3 ubiquitin-protein ligase HUWE1
MAINPSWESIENAPQLFAFAGEVLAHAFACGERVPVNLVRSLRKQLLARKLALRDLALVLTPDDYKPFDELAKSDPKDYGIFFVRAVEYTDGRAARTFELIPGGEDVEVTLANRDRYVQLVVEFVLEKAVEVPVREFVRGFLEVIPRDIIVKFDAEELDLMICGLPEINVDDLKANTRLLEGFTWESSPVIWFFEMMEEASAEMRARVLAFATGSPQVPFDGFRGLKPHFALGPGGGPEHLPKAHTCFNILNLPPYESKEQLVRKFNQAIESSNEFTMS